MILLIPVALLSFMAAIFLVSVDRNVAEDRIASGAVVQEITLAQVRAALQEPVTQNGFLHVRHGTPYALAKPLDVYARVDGGEVVRVIWRRDMSGANTRISEQEARSMIASFSGVANALRQDWSFQGEIDFGRLTTTVRSSGTIDGRRPVIGPGGRTIALPFFLPQALPQGTPVMIIRGDS